jgi:hypothetical protein
MPNGPRFTGVERARETWVREQSKPAINVRCNRIVGHHADGGAVVCGEGASDVTLGERVTVCRPSR